MANTLTQLVRTYGPLRLGLITLVIVDMLLRPVPGSNLELEGIAIVANLIAPVLAPILFMLLLLDFLMSLVYQSALPIFVSCPGPTCCWLSFSLPGGCRSSGR